MLRFFIVRNHYRSTQNYAPDNLYDAQQALDRLYQTLANVPPVAEAGINWNSEASQQFREAMNDDFNTAGAVAVLFDLANQINREKCAELSAELKALGGVLGLLQHEPQVYLRSSTRYLRDASAAASTLTDTEIDALVLERNEAKANKNFARADEIRAQLRTEGIELEDKAGGLTQWRRA